MASAIAMIMALMQVLIVVLLLAARRLAYSGPASTGKG
jgi:putative spermidine/putrescine transport system permease protein